jgi:imidazoleglycerol-phosphate dehydratase
MVKGSKPMQRMAEIERKTKETQIQIQLHLDGTGNQQIDTGIGFLDHMLTLFSVHGFFDLTLQARGDLEVDAHHTVEDIGLVLGETISQALGDRQGIIRYGQAVVPMDEALASVTIDLSNRPFVVYNVPAVSGSSSVFDAGLAKEFFRALANKAGMNLHINVAYGENEHHILEAIFKALARALDQAAGFDQRITGVRSSKGSL